MKRLLMICILLIASNGFAQRYQEVQSTVIHGSYLQQTVRVNSGETDSLVVEFDNTIIGNPASFDTLASDVLPISGWVTEDKKWSGYCEIDVYITNTDLATDSLIVAVYSLDRNGYVRANDVVYLKLAVYPGYSTSAYYNAWTTTTYYRGSITGAFGKGTHGLLITINATDETASHTGLARIRVYL